MPPASVQRLRDAGQSIWLDFMSREILDNGWLQGMVDDGLLQGLTSNPSIFSKAVTGSEDYDAQLAALAREGVTDAYEAFVRLAVDDIRRAADIFRPIYDASEGRDGFVSLELPPGIERDTPRSVAEARRLAGLVDRPNLMIKVPGTSEGIEAASQLTAHGINVNITLLFSVEVYERFALAYMAGLEQRRGRGERLDNVASVASFFVSRVDGPVDSALPQGSPLRGEAAIANALLAYRRFQELTGTPRWRALAEAGARPQLPLWGSTSTKNPAYPDTLYVDRLVLPQTVNTIPQNTIEAFVDHGDGSVAGAAALDAAPETLAALTAAGVDLDSVTAQLLTDGLASFAKDFDTLLDRVREALASKAA